jgi:predicted nucleic acid-binding protein
LSFALKRAGKQIGLADCYLAVAASNENSAILTLDEHFLIIRDFLKLNLLPNSGKPI